MSGRLPSWFRQKLPDPQKMGLMTAVVEDSRLHTICQSALCPNAGECFSSNTATFLILGDACTRHCTFCAVGKGPPLPPDPDEAVRIRDAVRALALRHVVITSVTRDDLPDGGASQFAKVIQVLRQSGVSAEVLVPDFHGSLESVQALMESCPEVVNHNIETVPRLYGEVRPGADYRRSLQLLRRAKQLKADTIVKSGLMVGLGESDEEIIRVMKDLRRAGCDLLTIGQYLQPSPSHHPVERFVTPSEFSEYEREAERIGFAGVASAPLVRSSYHAAEMYRLAVSKRRSDGIGAS